LCCVFAGLAVPCVSGTTPALRGGEEWRELLTRVDAALQHGVVLAGGVFQVTAPGPSFIKI